MASARTYSRERYEVERQRCQTLYNEAPPACGGYGSFAAAVSVTVGAAWGCVRGGDGENGGSRIWRAPWSHARFEIPPFLAVPAPKNIPPRSGYAAFYTYPVGIKTGSAGA
jgi:hypothetical protein